MYIGTQIGARDEQDFKMWAQLGVKNVCSAPAGNPHDWTLEDLLIHREKVESFGVTLDSFHLPLSSRPLNESQSMNIMLGKSPERDREIESIQNIISLAGQAGIPSVNYNLNIIGIPRSENEIGRGGSRNSTFRWSKMNPESEAGIWGILDSDTIWERIDYFLARVAPVAEECKIRIACHPHDPYTPPGFMGVTRVLGTVEGLKKFTELHANPYHGLNFCQGTVSEMLEDPGEEIYDVIRWFGERQKIFNVHFRNIQGGKLKFMESFPDEGAVDMVKAARAYQDVGYKYMLMPDHVPEIDSRDPSGTAFAFCYGYIAGVLQAIGEPRESGWLKSEMP